MNIFENTEPQESYSKSIKVIYLRLVREINIKSSMAA